MGPDNSPSDAPRGALPRIKGHVDDGRRALNFSEFDPAHGRGRDASRTVLNGSMPPSYYTWLGRHPEAKLTAAERKSLADGLLATLGDTGDDRRRPRSGD